jgi:retron-type reverse transcriptase
MYGFRPNRGQRDALKELGRQIEHGKTNYIVDADIKNFFNDIKRDVILELIKSRIGGPNILWLIKKILTAYVEEDGVRHPTVRGTQQGNLASPIIANVCMHYALALWFDVKFKKEECR